MNEDVFEQAVRELGWFLGCVREKLSRGRDTYNRLYGRREFDHESYRKDLKELEILVSEIETKISKLQELAVVFRRTHSEEAILAAISVFKDSATDISSVIKDNGGYLN